MTGRGEPRHIHADLGDHGARAELTEPWDYHEHLAAGLMGRAEDLAPQDLQDDRNGQVLIVLDSAVPLKHLWVPVASGVTMAIKRIARYLERAPAGGVGAVASRGRS